MLDGRDLVILRHLSANSRCSLSPIARETGLTPETVSRRIAVLAEAGVIRRFTLFVDISKLGYELYNVQISLTAPNPRDESAIIEFLTKHPKISYCERLITYWNIEFGVFIKHPDELREVIRELRGAFPRKIRVTDTHVFYGELSSIALPKGAFTKNIERTMLLTVGKRSIR
ncbi:MAG: Lrp/AsnC family transcriptional regulator [Candidatus Micrarchaeota archaeon]